MVCVVGGWGWRVCRSVCGVCVVGGSVCGVCV